MLLSLLLLSAQAAAPVQIPVMRVPTQPPPVTTIRPNTGIMASLRPDIVVKEIRKAEGGASIRALITNEGSADITRSFNVIASANYRSIRARPQTFPAAGPLKAGESQWVTFPAFFRDDVSWYPGIAPPKLSEWDQVNVQADVYSAPGWGATPVFPPDPKGKTCTPAAGCVVESNETNNSLTAAVSTLAD